MCFSAGASFVASGFLSIVGLLSLRKAPKKYLLFAAIPFLFAIQQLSEGFLWSMIEARPAHALEQSMIYIFLFFAFVVWPTWIPLSTHILEQNQKRKRLIGFLLVVGVVISSILLAGIIFNGAMAHVVNCHIVYTVPNFVTIPSTLGIFVYACATIGPFFVVSLPGAAFIGGIIALSCVLSWLIWHMAFTSVWCFFAALLSLFIFMFIPHKKG